MFRHGDKVLESLVAILQFGSLMPAWSKFTATANVGDNVYAAVLEPGPEIDAAEEALGIA